MNWRAKEEKGKSMVYVLYALPLAKRQSQDEVTLNSEEIKPVALSIVKLCLPGGIN